MNKLNEIEIQKQYYEKTFAAYDAAHAEEHELLKRACEYISFYASSLGCKSLLDVGCGTGRILKYFLETQTGLTVRGVEPIEAMVRYGRESNQIPEEVITVGRGDALDYPDACFDIVCEFAVLHHVREPNKMISEMIRVANKAIFLADSNRFGQGGRGAKVVKLLLYKMGLWKVFDFIRTGGKGYMISEGDGLFYSYSVYDSYNQLAQWADRIILIPLDKPGERMSHGWCNPLLTSPGVLLCAFRDS